MIKKKRLNLNRKKSFSGYLFILPVLTGMAFLFLPAVAESLIYTFHNVTIEFNNISKEFIGIRNFRDAFISDSEFRVILLGAVKGILIDSAVIILFSFFISNVLNQKFIGRGITRTIFFLPVVLSAGIVAALENANEMYNAMQIVTQTEGSEFDQMGMQAMFSTMMLVSKLGFPTEISGAIVSVINNMYNIVNSCGVQILVFLSALQSINPSVFEAARVEGATKWEEFWKITFPMLTPSLLVAIVYTIIDTFTNPVYGVMDYIETQAFSSGKLGYASALSWIYFLIVILVLGIAAGFISRRVTYLE